MVKLHVSEEAIWLHDFVEDSLSRFQTLAKDAETTNGKEKGTLKRATSTEGSVAAGRGVNSAETEFMCAHIRRQDFEASCARYEEEYRSGRCVFELDIIVDAISTVHGGVLLVVVANARSEHAHTSLFV